MFNMGSAPSLADIAAVTKDGNGDGWGNGNGWLGWPGTQWRELRN